MLFFLADMPVVYIGVLFLAGIGLLLLFEKLFLPNRPADTSPRRVGKGVFRVLFLVVYCLACAVFCYQSGIRKEHDHRLQWAEKIAFSRDTAAETRFRKQLTEKTDLGLPELLSSKEVSSAQKDSIAAILKKLLFAPVFSEYQYFFTFCGLEEELLVDTEPENCRRFFERKAKSGTHTGIEGLTVMDYGVEYYAYLYRTALPLGLDDTLLVNVEMGRKKFSDHPDGTGLHLPPSYSYAFYGENNLWSHNGTFLYPLTISKIRSDSLYFVSSKQFSHLVYPLTNQRFLIVSTPEPHPTAILHDFSFFFLLFGLCGLILLAVFDKNFLGTAGTYARQLRIGIFMLILFVFVVFGIAGIVFIRQSYLNENLKLLRQQSLSILAEIESRYGEMSAESLWNADNDSLQATLQKDIEYLSALFRNDIYLYSPDGQRRVGPSGNRLIADFLTYNIIEEMREEQSHMLIRRERINAHTSSLLAFMPLRNIYNEISGFFCIPYYMPEGEKNREMSRFVGTYLNIVVLFSLLTFIISSLLARRITRPLSLITGMVARIKLTRKNEHLPWKRNDEIGGLVKQYNLLVDELETSSRKLAESERENAWSEMARQVAHEIKNPLTPMKLQVQQLQRAYRDGREDFSERLDKFAAMLTEQIDRLAEIAGTFSKFAQWQQPQIQAVRVSKLILNAAELFKASEHIEFRTEIPPQATNREVNADPGFAEQILINLIRNAMQALEEMPPLDRKAVIRIGITQELTQETVIYVADNGPGIAAEKLERIFEPHFTTRSTGTGLGLAICRRLAESMNGSLSVESIPGKGSCFKLSLPCYNIA